MTHYTIFNRITEESVLSFSANTVNEAIRFALFLLITSSLEPNQLKHYDLYSLDGNNFQDYYSLNLQAAFI